MLLAAVLMGFVFLVGELLGFLPGARSTSEARVPIRDGEHVVVVISPCAISTGAGLALTLTGPDGGEPPPGASARVRVRWEGEHELRPYEPHEGEEFVAEGALTGVGQTWLELETGGTAHLDLLSHDAALEGGELGLRVQRTAPDAFEGRGLPVFFAVSLLLLAGFAALPWRPSGMFSLALRRGSPLRVRREP